MGLYDVEEADDTVDTVEFILDVIFGVIITLNMFLCFFSLTASMTTNIYEQSPEIAVMRAMGFTRRRITFMYIYEAFVLVLSASILGICIGVVIGWSMTMQRVLFT